MAPEQWPPTGAGPGTTALSSPPVEVSTDEPRPPVVVVRDWPKRTALLLGAMPPSILASLHKHGLASVPARAGDPVEPTVAGPFTFMVITANSLHGVGAVATVKAWHRTSPSARLLLSLTPEERDPDLLARSVLAGVGEIVDPRDAAALDRTILTGLRTAGTRRERVLAISAHPDDVGAGCAQTLLAHRQHGDRISVLVLSRGAPDGEQPRLWRDAADTAETLGAQLMFANTGSPAVSAGPATIRTIKEVVRSLDPTLIYVHSAFDPDADHRTAAIACASATFGMPRVQGYPVPHPSVGYPPPPQNCSTLCYTARLRTD